MDERRAHVAAAEAVSAYIADAADRETKERQREARGVTFREVATDYLKWLEDVKGAKPATLRNHRSVLGEPGTSYRRGPGTLKGYVMGALGDRPASVITTREIEDLLSAISTTGASARTVNNYRAVIRAVFSFGMRETTYSLPHNPAAQADKRREPHRGPLDYYSAEEIEALARSLAAGSHRNPTEGTLSADEAQLRRDEDAQDAELVRIAAYSGLRLGELLALRWRDVDFARHALTVSRAISDGIESSTKSGRVRRVPLPDQAAGALDRLSQRADFTHADDHVFCNGFGRMIDGSALRRRFVRARDSAGLRHLRFHDLRHTYGSLLAAGGVPRHDPGGDGSRCSDDNGALSPRSPRERAGKRVHAHIRRPGPGGARSF